MDPAIAGRITLRLDYPAIDNAMRERIWTDMLSAAGFTTTQETINHLASSKDLNGRQVRNQVRLLKILYPDSTELNLDEVSRCLRYIA
jgi:DNA polymerase III delta subunit